MVYKKVMYHSNLHTQNIKINTLMQAHTLNTLFRQYFSVIFSVTWTLITLISFCKSLKAEDQEALEEI